jgi:ArsR family transcriptional regulator
MKRRTSTNPIADRLAALSDVVRLRVLRLLEREELAVGEVAKVVQLPQSTVSRHLKVLADGGWVIKRTEGTATLYRLTLDDLSSANRGVWVAVRELIRSPDGKRSGMEAEEDLRRLESVLAERREDSLGYFGRVAGQWDEVRTELFGARFTSLGLLSLLPREWVVADLGCGTGNASELLAPLVKRVIAVDQSGPMLSAAKRRLGGVKNVEFVEGELTKLPLKDASVDVAVCVLVLHHVEKPGDALAEMRRIVRPGGQALVVDMAEHDRSIYRHTMGHRWLGFSEQHMGAMMTGAGFERARYAALPSDPNAKGPGLFACTGHVSIA